MVSKTRERAARLHNLAARYQSEGDPKRPERLYLQALDLKKQLFGPNHTEVALTCNNLGLFYKTANRLAEARQCYQTALAILERELGGANPAVGDVLYNLAQLSRKEAEALDARAAFIRESAEAVAQPDWRCTARIQPGAAKFRLRVDPSRIHRFGVFAGEPIPAGACIIEYTGERISRRESVRRTSGPSRIYLCRLDSYWNLDGGVNGSGAEFINHSCEANVGFHRGNGRVWVRSLRRIDTGEELLLDYNFPKHGPRVTCYCGSAACRGTINRR